VDIRRVRESDWERFRSVRLEALRVDPLAFGSTLDRELAYPEAKWTDWVMRASTGDSAATFIAETPDGRIVGLTGVFSEPDEFHLWGMWVEPNHRRAGIGRGLLNAALVWADTTDPRREVVLSVNPAQTEAVGLYRSVGFLPTGRSEPLGHHPPAVAQEMRRSRGGASP